jgi:putative alpha-1,2-mannosidase
MEGTMKKIYTVQTWFKVVALTCVVLSVYGCCRTKTRAVDYVNPNIGTIGHLLVSTSPDVQWPGGQVKLAPFTTPGITDKYLADKIYGFPLRESSHRRSVVTALIMATCGELSTDNARNAAEFDHDLETSTPYYYAITLVDRDIRVEATVTEHCTYYRFTFPKTDRANLLISLSRDSFIEVINGRAVRGFEPGRAGKAYFHAEFQKGFDKSGTWCGQEIKQGSANQRGEKIGAFVSFAARSGEGVEVKIGHSMESAEQAEQFLHQEIPGWAFTKAREAARAAWQRSLQTVQVQGGERDQLIKFYTALYRVGGGDALLEEMRINGSKLVRQAQDYARKSSDDVVPAAYKQGVMFQHMNISLIADLYLHGLCDYDLDKAYANAKAEFLRATKIPWCKGPATELDRFYLQHGFIPALAPGQKEWVAQVDSFEKRQSVTITLQAAYESWCLAQLAKALGNDEDYHCFKQHALDYRNLYNPQNGFMSPKTADGKWVEPFDPKWSGGLGGRDYFAEMNSWTYTWYVAHDIQGLIDLMGGRDKFVERLDAVFTEQYDRPDAKYRFLGQFPDETGLIGQYAHGNEFSRHIPYLYNYAGAPWKTQKRVREIMDVWYGTGPHGICGDEDSGLMSLWFVYAAMGIQPANIMCPNYAVWLISSPVFAKVDLDLKNGKHFYITSLHASRQNKYIQSAVLNGAPLNRPWLKHEEVAQGGKLVLTMGAKPNKVWGSDLAAAPPSMSSISE